MLETCGVGGVSGDGNVYILLPHDGHTLRNGVGAVAVYLGTGAVGISDSLHLGNGVGIGIILCLHEGEAVDSGDDLCGILAETVQDDTQGILTNLVGVVGDTDGALSCCEGLVSCQEAEALSILRKEHLAQVAVSQTYLTVVCHRARNTEGLQALTDGCCCICCCSAILLDGNGSTDNICPCSILEADRLHALHHIVNVETSVLCQLLSLLDILDTNCIQSLIDLLNTSLVSFK